MDIDFELYKVFFHAAHENNFSAAARKLHISQSAVSQHIKNLEGKLGVSLFLRKGKELALTREGQWLYSHVQQAYNLLKTAEAKMDEFLNLQAGEIRIGASDTVCRYFLLPFLQRFNKAYPKIKIRFVNRTSSQIRKVLTDGGIDFGVVTLRPGEAGPGIIPVAVVHDIFVASPEKFPQLKRAEPTLDDLAQYPILLLEQSSASRQNFDAFLKARGKTLSPEFELESMDLLVEFARIGLGISYVLKDSVDDLLADGTLIEVPVKDPLPSRTLGIVTPHGIPLSEAAKRFIALAKTETND